MSSRSASSCQGRRSCPEAGKSVRKTPNPFEWGTREDLRSDRRTKPQVIGPAVSDTTGNLVNPRRDCPRPLHT